MRMPRFGIRTMMVGVALTGVGMCFFAFAFQNPLAIVPFVIIVLPIFLFMGGVIFMENRSER